jgi:antirestriction protein ArdC
MTEIRDVYSRITGKIIADLEQGIRPWHRPWSADHAAGRITRPLRHNGIPYNGINVVMLWSAAVTKGYACPLWLTFKQAIELGGHVRKGEAGELVVYADRIRRTETDAKGEETEREIPFMKGYTVFNAEQCSELPAHYYAKAEPPALTPMQRLEAADRFFLCRDRCRDSPRRHPRLLRRRSGLCADATLRDLPRRRELRRCARS